VGHSEHEHVEQAEQNSRQKKEAELVAELRAI
jgi:hypothetical protein